MNASRLSHVRCLLLSFLAVSAISCVMADGTNNAEQTVMAMVSEKTHRTWEGLYTCSGVTQVRIEGQTDLYAVKYSCPDHEGNLVDFVILDAKNHVFVLYAAPENIKGVSPVFEGIEVIPESAEAELIVRWRHPGNGENRLVEKYLYDSKSVRLVLQADLLNSGVKERGLKWVRRPEK